MTPTLCFYANQSSSFVSHSLFIQSHSVLPATGRDSRYCDIISEPSPPWVAIIPPSIRTTFHCGRAVFKKQKYWYSFSPSVHASADNKFGTRKALMSMSLSTFFCLALTATRLWSLRSLMKRDKINKFWQFDWSMNGRSGSKAKSGALGCESSFKYRSVACWPN